jgi:hypothetical protein
VSFRDGQNRNVICYKQVINFVDLVLRLHILTWAIFSTFLGCLIVFDALLGSLSEVDLLMLFTLELIVQGELHKVVFLLLHTALVLTV